VGKAGASRACASAGVPTMALQHGRRVVVGTAQGRLCSPYGLTDGRCEHGVIHSPLYGGAFLEMHMNRDDRVDRAFRRVCAVAADAGEITFDQLNALLPADQFTAEQIEELLNRLSEREIQIIES
jgi:hypothetical protein